MERGGGYRGQKKRQRGGASKSEGGLWGLEMDGNILFFPPLSPAVSHTEQWIQSPAKLCGGWKSCKIQKSWAFIRRCSSVFKSICLSAHRAPCGGDAEGTKPERRQMRSRFDLCPAFFSSPRRCHKASQVTGSSSASV